MEKLDQEKVDYWTRWRAKVTTGVREEELRAEAGAEVGTEVEVVLLVVAVGHGVLVAGAGPHRALDPATYLEALQGHALAQNLHTVLTAVAYH